MTDIQRQQLEKLIEEGYDFSSSQFMQIGWKLFRRQIGMFLGFLLLTVVIGIVLGFIPTVGLFVNSLLISPILTVGYYLYAHQLGREPAPDFDVFFKGRQFWQPLILKSLVVAVILLVAYSPSIIALQKAGFFEWYMQLMEDPIYTEPAPKLPDSTSWVIWLNLIPIVYLMVSYIWAGQLIIFYKLNFWEALEYSRRLVTRRWLAMFSMLFTFFSLAFLAYIPAVLLLAASPALGGILMFVAMLVILAGIPFFYCTLYVSFAYVTRFREAEKGKVQAEEQASE